MHALNLFIIHSIIQPAGARVRVVSATVQQQRREALPPLDRPPTPQSTHHREGSATTRGPDCVMGQRRAAATLGGAGGVPPFNLCRRLAAVVLLLAALLMAQQPTVVEAGPFGKKAAPPPPAKPTPSKPAGCVPFHFRVALVARCILACMDGWIFMPGPHIYPSQMLIDRAHIHRGGSSTIDKALARQKQLYSLFAGGACRSYDE